MLVLIADDNPTMRVLLERAVMSAGTCEIDFVGTGTEALRCFKLRCHDLILLDLSMPQMSGADVLINLRDHPALDRTHVIMVTGNVDKQLVAKIKGERLKVDDLIVKPFDLQKLTGKIANVMARTRNRRRGDGPILKPGNAEPAPRKATLTCTVIDRGGVAILELAGMFTANNSALVNAALKELQQLHARTVVVDLDQVTAIDDFGLGHLLVINGWLASLDYQGFLSFGRFAEKDRVVALGITHIVPIRELTDGGSFPEAGGAGVAGT